MYPIFGYFGIWTFRRCFAMRRSFRGLSHADLAVFFVLGSFQELMSGEVRTAIAKQVSDLASATEPVHLLRL